MAQSVNAQSAHGLSPRFSFEHLNADALGTAAIVATLS
jgi:hypothetical protein